MPFPTGELGGRFERCDPQKGEQSKEQLKSRTEKGNREETKRERKRQHPVAARTGMYKTSSFRRQSSTTLDRESRVGSASQQIRVFRLPYTSNGDPAVGQCMMLVASWRKPRWPGVGSPSHAMQPSDALSGLAEFVVIMGFVGMVRRGHFS
jgi:hypothetical protein